MKNVRKRPERSNSERRGASLNPQAATAAGTGRARTFSIDFHVKVSWIQGVTLEAVFGPKYAFPAIHPGEQSCRGGPGELKSQVSLAGDSY